MRRSTGIAVALTLVAPLAVHAQLDGAYRLSAGDTLTYQDFTSSTVEIDTPQGTIVAESTHDAVVRLTSGAPGSVAAWFTSLVVGSNGPNGNVTPDTEPLLGQPYMLQVTGTGDVETRSAPEPPAEVQAVTDLYHQFRDFLIRVPAERPTEGTEWADTLVSNESGIPETEQILWAVRRYEAEGDTVIDGRTLQRIRIETFVDIEASSPMEGQAGIDVATIFTGSEEGSALFDWEAGRLVSREKTGELSGTFQVIGGPQVAEFPQRMTYVARISGGDGGA